MSIDNVVGALRGGLGADPTAVAFRRPTPPEAFDVARSESLGVTSIELDSVVRVGPEHEWSKERLMKELERRGRTGATEER